ncbi:RyR domain-containing protein [Catenulispora pinisilvae]|uniref:RyR domain-containing protein n=1 Tax=Catenulispora pinisilvae TaxID=2705253 RepID=UPI001890C84C|nr:RyR domain-containing protein [Catenulispora pinisilvae]
MTARHNGSATPRFASVVRVFFITVGVISLVLGYLGLDRYLGLPGQHYSHAPSDLIYFDLELFLIQSTPLAMGGPFPWQLSVARFSAPSVALYAIAEIVVAVSARRVRRAWLRRSRNHAVVFGTTRIASVVVERLRAQGKRVLVVRPDTAAGTVGFDNVLDDRWTVVGVPASQRTLTDAGVRRASAVYACLDRIEDNSEVAYAIEAWRRGQRFPERVYASIDDLDLCTALKARRWSMAGAGRSHVDFFNRDELAAQTVVRRDRSALDGPAPHMAISGTGAFARSVLVELGRQRLSRTDQNDDPITIVLVGADADTVGARLREQYPFLGDVCVIEPWLTSLSQLFDERRQARAPRLRRLYLCQSDERDALADALTCGSYLSAMDGVVVRLDRMSQMADMFHGGGRPGTLFDALDGRLELVDVTEVGCDPDRIGDDLADSLARSIHRRYLTDQLSAGRSWHSTESMIGWDELPPDLQRGNREQAEDVGRKLASIRCLLTPLRQSVEPFVFRPAEIETLAEAEHARWAAERRRNGWRYGLRRDDARRVHPGLVPWPVLPEDQRQKDRSFIRALPTLLSDMGLAVVRVQERHDGPGRPAPPLHAQKSADTPSAHAAVPILGVDLW